ncbi:MAG: ATP-binding cassette domain-containing protein [Nitrospirae bacterium]|nr:ATP-binding cassette domain-containing protein [Nitrospirota bacterium]
MKALISVRNLNKTFSGTGIELQVLKGINLEIYEGEVAAIMGPSGVGKSTLLHIIGTLDNPTSGEVFYENRDISSFDEDALAGFRNRTIGFIFQFHHLLPEFSAVENIMMPAMISQGSRGQGVKGSSYGEIKENAERLLKELGVYEGGLCKERCKGRVLLRLSFWFQRHIYPQNFKKATVIIICHAAKSFKYLLLDSSIQAA